MFDESLLTIPEDLVWRTRADVRVRLGDMNDMHLSNAAHFLRTAAHAEDMVFWRVRRMTGGIYETPEDNDSCDCVSDTLALANAMDEVRRNRVTPKKATFGKKRYWKKEEAVT